MENRAYKENSTVEENNEETSKRGIRLKSLVYVLLAVTVIFSCLNIYGMSNVNKKYNAVTTSVKDYSRVRDSVDNLQAGSDYLTEQVRQYVITGNTIYRDNYFYEVEVTQRRDIAVESIISEVQIGDATVENVRQALISSIELMDAEYYAMRIIAYLNNEDESTLPDEVRDVTLKPEDLSKSESELKEYAYNLVFGNEYAESKADINEKLGNAILEVKKQISTDLDNSTDNLKQTLAVQVILTIIIMVLVVVSVVILIVLVIWPLSTYDENIRKGEPLKVSGSQEFKRLAATYNDMLAQSTVRKNRLKYKAEHDELTRLLNRATFDKLCESLTDTGEDIALLMIDLDQFKHINDSYGHIKGDNALKIVADALINTFRNDDYCIRYGGDEFVVIMSDITEQSAYTISSKIRQINLALKKASEEYIALTVSVGVAFSDNGYTPELLEKADKALYHSKENGRNGYTFYSDTEMRFHAG